jgi:hypothetical protein
MLAIAQIAGKRQSAKVVAVCLHRLRIVIGGQHHPVTCCFKSQAQTTPAAEKIGRKMLTVLS